jgi:hemerythrin-like metal-binding protein
MAFFEWTEDLCVNVPVIDAQHKRLFEMAEALFIAMKAGAGHTVLEITLDDLVAYTEAHFATEEKIIAKRKCQDLEAHLREHAVLRQCAHDFQTRFADGTDLLTIALMQFMRNWLNTHIRVEDMHWAKD